MVDGAGALSKQRTSCQCVCELNHPHALYVEQGTNGEGIASNTEHGEGTPVCTGFVQVVVKSREVTLVDEGMRTVPWSRMMTCLPCAQAMGSR